MALDKNLFTLNIEPSKIEPSAIDLVDPSGTVHYRKRWVPNESGTYCFSVSEPLSDSILATASGPTAASKEKVIELHNPSVTVPLAFKGTLTFKWGFKWEEHDFEWKREACYMIRKPDPPVLVAVTKEPAGKIKTSIVQILDYNLNRFDIEDRKGLEIVLLTSLLTFGDYNDNQRSKSGDASTPVPTLASIPPTVPPPPPPKPEGWTEDQIAILQAKEQRDVNEVVIGEAGNVEEYVQHCVSLLNDETLLFITLRSLTPSCVSKVVQVAEATKRLRYKNSGYDDEQELHQYVDMSFDDKASGANKGKTKGKGPRIINLDDRPASAPTPPNTTTYQPPNTLTIHLSKISMPELEPKSKHAEKKGRSSATPSKTPSVPSQSQSKPSSSGSHSERGKKKPTLTKPPPQGAAPAPSGLRAKFSAFKSSSASPPPGSQSSSKPKTPVSSVPPHSVHTPRHSSSNHPPPPHLRIPTHPLTGHGPSPQQPAYRSRPQSAIYPPPPSNFGGYAPPFPGPAPSNGPPIISEFYPSSFVGAPPPPQQASGGGFFRSWQ